MYIKKWIVHLLDCVTGWLKYVQYVSLYTSPHVEHKSAAFFIPDATDLPSCAVNLYSLRSGLHHHGYLDHNKYILHTLLYCCIYKRKRGEKERMGVLKHRWSSTSGITLPMCYPHFCVQTLGGELQIWPGDGKKKKFGKEPILITRI